MTDRHAVPDEQTHDEELYRLHHSRVVRLCRLLLADPHEAEDVAQEVFVKLLQASKTETRAMWQPAPPTLPLEAHQEPIWPFIEGVSAALFPSVEVGSADMPDRLVDLADLQAALGGEWPCEEQPGFATLACDDDTVALLLGEQ